MNLTDLTAWAKKKKSIGSFYIWMMEKATEIIWLWLSVQHFWIFAAKIHRPRQKSNPLPQLYLKLALSYASQVKPVGTFFKASVMEELQRDTRITFCTNHFLFKCLVFTSYSLFNDLGLYFILCKLFYCLEWNSRQIIIISKMDLIGLLFFHSGPPNASFQGALYTTDPKL